MEKVVLDGSMGEGGGQILRTALAFSALTQKPLQITKIRANRPNPGLRPQHLVVAQAFREICDAHLGDAEVGSMTIGGIFKGEIKALKELIILSTGKCSGKIVCKNLVVEAGGFLNARVTCLVPENSNSETGDFK